MKTTRTPSLKALAVPVLLALAFGATTPAFANSGESERGIEPIERSGNFVSSDDDQVCYDMSAQKLIGEVTSEMRGFKIDPPVNYSNAYVSTELSLDGKYLGWKSLSGAKMLAFIIKGGPNYHVYNYVATDFTWDNKLHSPATKKSVPQISHYNVCYEVDNGDQGCTPGYWRNHANRWAGVSPEDDFDTTFGLNLFTPDITLAQAIWAQGGGNFALARHATAALLNAHGGKPNADGTTVRYDYTADEVIAMVLSAVANGTVEETKNLLETANERGCPLSGSKADPVER